MNTTEPKPKKRCPEDLRKVQEGMIMVLIAVLFTFIGWMVF